jgi:hypothetical protein
VATGLLYRKRSSLNTLHSLVPHVYAFIGIGHAGPQLCLSVLFTCKTEHGLMEVVSRQRIHSWPCLLQLMTLF